MSYQGAEYFYVTSLISLCCVVASLSVGTPYWSRAYLVSISFIRHRWRKDALLRKLETRDLPKDIGRVLYDYNEWVDRKDVMVLENNWRGYRKGVLTTKRGNCVYRWKMAKKFKSMVYKCPDYRHRPYANVFFVTLTTAARGMDFKEAWLEFGVWFNRWTATMRSKVKGFGGRMAFLRVWEAFPNEFDKFGRKGLAYGFPHAHVMVVFETPQPVVYIKGVWRAVEKERFRCGWKSWVDVRAAYGKEPLNYISKYLVKDGNDLTMALTWLFERHTISFGRRRKVNGVWCQSVLFDLISCMESFKGVQVDLFGNRVDLRAIRLFQGCPVPEWSFLGVFVFEDVGRWVFVLSDSQSELVDEKLKARERFISRG